MPLATNDRLVALDGVYNFRDLGGYRTTDGRSIHWQRLFRADGLDKLTVDDVEALRPIGLQSVIDLRSQAEIDRVGRFPVETHPVTWHHLSITDTTWDRDEALKAHRTADDFLTRAYAQMLRDGAPRFAKAFELLADTDALPAVFHCAAGKDRTGILAALVLGSLRVDTETIVADFALTEDSMPKFIAAMQARYPERVAEMASVPPAFMSANPAAMRSTIRSITADHGSIRNYVREIGVPNDVVDHLAGMLLTD
jgi:protein-tyrosine phosphatase